MGRFVLVHGACHGAWCWSGVVEALRIAGHEAMAINLPCRGGDPTPASAATLAGFARAVADAVDGRVTLVGHSAAGFPITAATSLIPGKIERLVYVAAFVPQGGQSLAQIRKSWPDQPLRGSYVMNDDRSAFTFRDDRIADLFYHDCPVGTAALARRRLCPEPVAPQEEAVTDTRAAESLPRSYVLCTQDRAVPPALQAEMTRTWRPNRVHRLGTGHSPFFAAPSTLARLITAE